MIGWNLILSLISLAIAKRRTTWFIDGDNLISHRGTPSDRNTIVNKLKPIKGADVVLVFDGCSDIPKKIQVLENIETVQLSSEDVSADDYIMKQIDLLIHQHSVVKVQVVTADRELRSRVLQNRVVKGVVNPVTFWKRYLPRLGGLKAKAVAPASFE